MLSKRMKDLKTKVDKTKSYSIEEAIKLVKETSNVKFDASVEVHANLGIDPKKSDQQIRATVVLPHGTGKTKKIAAFVGANDEKDAKEAGADFVYSEEDIKKLQSSGKIEFDLAVSTPEMMPKMALVARILGPKGLMPNPKTGTVDANVKKMIGDLKRGKTSFKNDDTSNIHQVIGKVSFTESQLKENFETFLETLKKIKPMSSKGIYIKSLFLTSSMGPSIKIDVQ
ncbi:MAG: 50S ribosomal protein L1 [Patescibacteria group bacterium]